MKLKTRSSVKKRFNLTASGKLTSGCAGKNHFMRHKTNKQSRNLRGTRVIVGQQASNLIKTSLPYGL